MMRGRLIRCIVVRPLKVQRIRAKPPPQELTLLDLGIVTVLGGTIIFFMGWMIKEIVRRPYHYHYEDLEDEDDEE